MHRVANQGVINPAPVQLVPGELAERIGGIGEARKCRLTFRNKCALGGDRPVCSRWYRGDPFGQPTRNLDIVRYCSSPERDRGLDIPLDLKRSELIKSLTNCSAARYMRLRSGRLRSSS